MNNLNSLQCLLVQTRLFWADADANRRQLQAIARSRGSDSNLIVFPETMDGHTLEWMKSLASELDCVLCCSVAISTGQGRVNRLLWYGSTG